MNSTYLIMMMIMTMIIIDNDNNKLLFSLYTSYLKRRTKLVPNTTYEVRNCKKKKTTKVLQTQPSRSNSRRQRLRCPFRYKVDVALAWTAGGPVEREMVTLHDMTMTSILPLSPSLSLKTRVILRPLIFGNEFHCRAHETCT